MQRQVPWTVLSSRSTLLHGPYLDLTVLSSRMSPSEYECLARVPRTPGRDSVVLHFGQSCPPSTHHRELTMWGF